MVTDLQDSELLSRMATGDLIAIDAMYHRKCFIALRNRHRAYIRKCNAKEENFNEKFNECIAFIELNNYIQRFVESGTLLFKLTDLHGTYISHLQSMGIHKAINKTRLKEKILESLPEAQEQFDGRNTIIIFESGMKTMIIDALKKRDYTEDACAISKVANIIRQDILQHETYKFTGSFTSGCQESSVPASLKALVSMILHGSQLDDQQGNEPQACMTITQAIMFNTKHTKPEDKHTHKNEHSRHSLQREPPLPLYVGLTIHNTTRSKKMVQLLYKLGLSVSYDRILQIEDKLAASLCKQFDEDGIVCPSSLRKSLFTAGAIDNIDHNLSSMSANSSFHGTGISLFQNPTASKPGEDRPPVSLPTDGNRSHHLPDCYAVVPAVELRKSSSRLPPCPVIMSQTTGNDLELAVEKEN